MLTLPAANQLILAKLVALNQKILAQGSNAPARPRPLHGTGDPHPPGGRGRRCHGRLTREPVRGSLAPAGRAGRLGGTCPPRGPGSRPGGASTPCPSPPLPPPAPALGGVALPPRGRPPVLASARAGRPLPRALLRPLRPRLRRSSRRSRWSPSLLFLHRRTARRRALRRVAPHPRLAFPKHPAVGPRAVATVPGAPSAQARAFLLAGLPAHRSLPSRHPGPSQSPPTLLPGRGLPRSADPPVSQ